jgi:hypothetical protein
MIPAVQVVPWDLKAQLVQILPTILQIRLVLDAQVAQMKLRAQVLPVVLDRVLVLVLLVVLEKVFLRAVLEVLFVRIPADALENNNVPALPKVLKLLLVFALVRQTALVEVGLAPKLQSCTCLANDSSNKVCLPVRVFARLSVVEDTVEPVHPVQKMMSVT